MTHVKLNTVPPLEELKQLVRNKDVTVELDSVNDTLYQLKNFFWICSDFIVGLNTSPGKMAPKHREGIDYNREHYQYNITALMGVGLDRLLMLKTLDLSGHIIGGNADRLKVLTCLVSLTLWDCDLTSGFVMPFLPNLTSLDISNNPYLHTIDGLTSLTSLTFLGVERCGLNGSLASLASLPRLTWLDVSYNPGLRNIGDLTTLTKLTILNVAGCRLDDDSLTKLTILNVAG